MRLTQSQLTQLETPCLVVDVAQVRRNIAKMQQAVARTGCALRPAHQNPQNAAVCPDAGGSRRLRHHLRQGERGGSDGSGRAADIFIAYPLVGAFRIRRALALARHLDR